MKLTPVNGSATADTSGVSRFPVARPAGTALATPRCHGGRSNSSETPPLVPSDSGTSYQDCSPSQAPVAVVDSVVPPTLTIAGREATEFSPMLSCAGADDQSSPLLHSSPARSPLAMNAVVPRPAAATNADCAGARSVAVSSLSQPQ